jgi:peptidoglycan/xylan/chitin deacetylase (PgdA/CDA1 family)
VTRAVSLLFHDVYVDHPAESGFMSDAADRYKLRLQDFEAQLDRVAAARADTPLVIGHGDGSTQRSQGREDRRGSRLTSSVAPAFGRRNAARSAATEGVRLSAISAPRRSLRLPSSPRPQPPPRSDADAGLPWLITFDDGGVSYHTLIADRLEARGWRGHCFVTTGCIGRRGFLDAAQIRDLDARGHVIGSHSESHPTRFSACSDRQMVAEWRNSRQALEDILGHEVRVASVPGGYFSPAVARSAQEAGVAVLFTSEPVTAIEHDSGLALIGRFTIRLGDADDAAMRFVAAAPWARFGAWTSWNAKGLIKPLLGPAYSRVADWLCSVRGLAPSSLASSGLRKGRSS